MALDDYRRRRRRPQLWRLVRFVLLLALVAGTAGYAYRIGVSATAVRIGQLEADLERFQEDNLGLRERLTVARQQERDAVAELAALRRRYEREVPDGASAALLAEIERQLAAGVEPERLRLLIKAASAPAPCESEPETKRFVVRTPISQGPVSAARLADRVIVTGRGEPARNAEGLAEAWYDPAAQVELVFRNLDGTEEIVEGVLPLRHTMVVDGRELRIAAIAGERSFVEVTGQTCPLPAARGEARDDPPAGGARSG